MPSNAGAIFRRGAKSFSLAALFFRRDTYEAAAKLYSWCRYCDDSVDDSPASASEVDRILALTLAALSGQSDSPPPFAALRSVADQYSIPQRYPLELIEGMAMDASGRRYETFGDLEVYAYHVAGTVGLMMTHVLGAKDSRAAHHAKQLGIAMQLTNISRDILEDAGRGRVYLPSAWLREEGLDPAHISRPEYRPALARLAARLVDHAEKYYEEGFQGLRYLKARHALAIAAAAGLYREIGRLVVQRGETAWNTRAVVPFLSRCRQIFLSPFYRWRYL